MRSQVEARLGYAHTIPNTFFVPTRKAIQYRLQAVSLFSWSVEQNALDTQMTTRVPSLLASSLLDARARVLPSLNLKKKRDCSPFNLVQYEHLFDMCLSILEISTAQRSSVKSVLMSGQKLYLVTACDLKCLRVSEGFWLFLVRTLSAKMKIM